MGARCQSGCDEKRTREHAERTVLNCGNREVPATGTLRGVGGEAFLPYPILRQWRPAVCSAARTSMPRSSRRRGSPRRADCDGDLPGPRRPRLGASVRMRARGPGEALRDGRPPPARSGRHVHHRPRHLRPSAELRLQEEGECRTYGDTRVGYFAVGVRYLRGRVNGLAVTGSARPSSGGTDSQTGAKYRDTFTHLRYAPPSQLAGAAPFSFMPRCPAIISGGFRIGEDFVSERPGVVLRGVPLSPRRPSACRRTFPWCGRIRFVVREDSMRRARTCV